MTVAWKDATAYSRDEQGKVAPRTWTLERAGLRIVVTRRHGIPDRWFLRCGPWFDEFDIGNVSAEDAQSIALGLVNDKVADQHNEWAKFWLTEVNR